VDRVLHCRALIGIVKRFVLMAGSAVVGLVFLIPYQLGVAVYGRPPVVPSLGSHLNMFQLLLFKTCEERNYLTYKVRLFLYFLQLLFLQPAFGCLWFLDDVLFPGYRSVKIEKPVFIIGDARTGTTQYVQILARDSKNFCAPITLNATLPVIHAWKVGTFICSFLTPELIKKGEDLLEAVYFSYLPREFQLRHEGGMWEPDTFEVQYNSLRIEFFTQLIDMKRTGHNWWFPQDEQRADFLRFLDAIWKKVSYHRGQPGQRMLIKGHFLKECEALQEMYPDAYFVALAREPEPRLVSQITFLWNGPWAGMAGVPRTVLKDLAEVLTEHLVEYSDSEIRFFDARPQTRISVPFEGYVKEIDESVKKTYRLCGIPVPAEVEVALARHVEEHRVWKQKRVQHDPDFTLEELGIDTKELARRHEKYLSRCVLPQKGKGGK
jgi:omega-hydroxy-beta-dihydromenaquinone-9 sulfotransferase